MPDEFDETTANEVQDTDATQPDFSWVPIYEELGSKLLEYRGQQKKLIELLKEAGVDQGLVDEDAAGNKFPLEEIDPFTFFALINKYGHDRRSEVLGSLKTKLELTSAVPTGYSGVPSAHAMQSWLFRYKARRDPEDIATMWQLFEEAVGGNIRNETFDKALGMRLVGKAKLTQALFRASPRRFLPIDAHTQDYLAQLGVKSDFDNYEQYSKILTDLKEKAPKKDFFEVSYASWLSTKERRIPKVRESGESYVGKPGVRYWCYAPGERGTIWEDCFRDGLMAIGWDDLGDLRDYPTKDAIGRALRDLSSGSKVSRISSSSQKNNAHACNSFANLMKPGDVVFAKLGRRKILGCGVVESDYYFAENRSEYKHVRKVRWMTKGEWTLPKSDRVAVKTLTDMTRYTTWVNRVKELTGFENPGEVLGEATSRNYWWIPAAPKIWNWNNTSIGGTQTYTSYNSQGRKRRIYRHFSEARPGDLVIGYLGTPFKKVVATAEIIRALHKTDEGDVIEFKKTEQLETPIGLDQLRSIPELRDSEPFANNHQGSLFRLTHEEYETIRAIIDEGNPPISPAIPQSYTIEDAVGELFMPEAQYREMVQLLEHRRAMVLQGPPGVGKTFVARRLAYSMLGRKDPSRVRMIQFHQSYSYEDFIQGYRPSAGGDFVLRDGVFYTFCQKAQDDPREKYFFIIDEINRGNLSKIFGELLMLIERDKRGQDFGVPLTYSQDHDDTFSVPENVYLIGTMNTADRSLAMVDYALRRRFCFVDLVPEFKSDKFKASLLECGATGDLISKIISGMSFLNEKISTDSNLGPGYRIGHSYFCPSEDWELNEEWYKSVIRRQIKPLMREYWFDGGEKADKEAKALLS